MLFDIAWNVLTFAQRSPIMICIYIRMDAWMHVCVCVRARVRARAIMFDCTWEEIWIHFSAIRQFWMNCDHCLAYCESSNNKHKYLYHKLSFISAFNIIILIFFSVFVAMRGNISRARVRSPYNCIIKSQLTWKKRRKKCEIIGTQIVGIWSETSGTRPTELCLFVCVCVWECQCESMCGMFSLCRSCTTQKHF